MLLFTMPESDVYKFYPGDPGDKQASATDAGCQTKSLYFYSKNSSSLKSTAKFKLIENNFWKFRKVFSIVEVLFSRTLLYRTCQNFKGELSFH